MASCAIEVGAVGEAYVLRVRPSIRITICTSNVASSIPTKISQRRAIRARSPLHPPHLEIIRQLNTRRPLKIGVLNAQSLDNKAAAINDCITSNHLQVMTVVESWHESMESASVLAAIPPKYHVMERSRPRLASNDLNQAFGCVCCRFYSVLHILHSANMQNTIFYRLVPDCSSIARGLPIFVCM